MRSSRARFVSLMVVIVALTSTPVVYCSIHYPRIDQASDTNHVKPLSALQVGSNSTAPNFVLTSPVSNLSIEQGFSENTTVNILGQNNFVGDIELDASVSPPGPLVLVNPPTAAIVLFNGSNGRGLSLVIAYTYNTTPVGNYNLTITGTSGQLASSFMLALSVTSPPPTPDFSVTASPPGLFVVSGSSGSSTITVTSLGGFNGNVTLNARVFGSFPGGPTVSTFPGVVQLGGATTGTSTLTFTAPVNQLGVFFVTLTGASGDVVHSETLIVNVGNPPPPPAGDFGMSISPSKILVVAGNSAQAAVGLFRLGQALSNITVELKTVAVLPFPLNGPVVTLSRAQISFLFSAESQLTVTTFADTPAGNSTFTVTGSSGSFFHEGTINVQVIPVPVLRLTPSSGLVGTKVLVQGSGFPVQFGQTEVTVTFDDQLLGFTFTQSGGFNFTSDVPLAQPGLHSVKAAEPFFNGNTQTIMGTATFQVLPNPSSFTVSLEGGTIYFPGDTASFFILVGVNGQPVAINDLQLVVSITRPVGSVQLLTTTQTTVGVYSASFAVPTSSSLGTYVVIVKAHSPTVGDSAAIVSFEVKPTWLSSHGSALALGGVTLVGLAALVGVSWQKGFFNKKRDENPPVWNNDQEKP